MRQRINRSEFLRRVTKDVEAFYPSSFMKRLGLSRLVTCIYDAIVNRIFLELSEGNEISLRDFGRFYLNKRKGHAVMDFQSGKQGKIKDYYVVKFAASVKPQEEIRRKLTEGGNCIVETGNGESFDEGAP